MILKLLGLSYRAFIFRDVINFFTSISENLSDLSAMLQNIEWINKFSFKRSDLVSLGIVSKFHL